MTPGQKQAIELFSGKYCIPYADEYINKSDYFNSETLCVEIGFGMGMATAEIAENNPEMGFLGIEVYKPGVGRLLSEIERRGLDNLKIVNHDAVEVLENMIGDCSIDGFHIFFPDPWPKKKHHKRRLINRVFAALLEKKLKPGGYVYAATDWEDYAEHILGIFSENPNLENLYTDWAVRPVWRPSTAFEIKGIGKKHTIREIYFKSVK
jgi:tRNA (guanine-N7-)-methyltransferase